MSRILVREAGQKSPICPKAPALDDSKNGHIITYSRQTVLVPLDFLILAKGLL